MRVSTTTRLMWLVTTVCGALTATILTAMGLKLDSVGEAGSSELVLGLIVGGIATLFLLTISLFVVKRSVGPVVKVTERVEAIASERLPAMAGGQANSGNTADTPGFPPLEAAGSVELRRLALAVNHLDQVASELVGAQEEVLQRSVGDLLVQLARRNQSLLERQIDYIDELERDETDPDVLANLFHLDHLATRMRRNAESLLVLSGVNPTRIRTSPVPVVDVIRSAVAEVEHYPRIRMSHADASRTAGLGATDLAHMLAELLDNALRYSAPTSAVTVIGRRAQDGRYQIEMTDEGVGLNGVQLDELNGLLSRPPESALPASQSLGLTVVSRLAARHGIEVRLDGAFSGGVTARVTVPCSLVLDAGPAGSAESHEHLAAAAPPPRDVSDPRQPLPRREPPMISPATGMQKPSLPSTELPRRSVTEPAVGLSSPAKRPAGQDADSGRPLWERSSPEVTIDLTDGADPAGPISEQRRDEDGGRTYSFLDARAVDEETSTPEASEPPPAPPGPYSRVRSDPGPIARTHEEVRRLLSSYRGGLKRAGEEPSSRQGSAADRDSEAEGG